MEWAGLAHSDGVTLPAGNGSFPERAIDWIWDIRGGIPLKGVTISMTAAKAEPRPGAVPQPVSAPLTRAAIFLVVTINPGSNDCAAVRSFCGDLAGIIRAVDFRNLEAGLSCVMGIGSEAWDRLFGDPRPAELHPFREVKAGSRHAVSTPGDLLFHIRAKRMDICFEMAAQIMARLGDAVTSVDEVHGFRYFDDRDLLGFVDGTENPRGAAVLEAAVIGEEDAAFAGGSYVIVQKYLHDLDGWNGLSTEAQERIIGRTKLADIELDESVKPTSAHNALTTISENGKELQIVRDNMPFGRVGKGEFGTYFIGYCRTPRVTEQMIENMFIGRPSGSYDRLLDFSRAVTGTLFFVPSATFLEADDDRTAAMPTEPIIASPQSAASVPDGSLGVGSLKGEDRHE
jgi:putative iron-dependent peroxidase